jgi:hypothetical protein
MTIPQAAAYLGLSEVLPVLVPYNIGRAKKAHAKEIKDEVFNYTIYSCTVVLFIVIVFALLFSSGEQRIFMVCAGLLVVLWELKRFFVTNCAAEKSFRKLSWIEFWFGLMTLVASCVLIYYFMGYGYWLGLLIPNILVVAWYLRDYRMGNDIRLTSVDVRRILSMIPLGVIMLLATAVYSPFVVTAKVFIVSTMGVRGVGLFVLSIIVISKMTIIPKTVASVVMPHVSSLRGRSEPFGRVFELFVKSQFLTGCLTCIVAISGFFLIEGVVEMILPRYLSGVAAAKIMLLASIPYALIYNANNVLIAYRYKRRYVRSFLSVFLLQIVVFGCLLLYGVTVKTISLAFCVVFLVYCIFVNYEVLRIRRGRSVCESAETGITSPLKVS